MWTLWWPTSSTTLRRESWPALIGIDDLSFCRLAFIPVEIDVKPGGDRNPVNPESRGTIPVAVLSTQTAAGEDVDSDGDLDLVVHFETQALVDNGDLAADTEELVLTGETADGTPIRGTDEAMVVDGAVRP